MWACPKSKGIFLVASYYCELVGGAAILFAWKSVWVTGPPSKVAFFVLAVTLRRILTINNLIRRRHILVNWCCMCCRDVESVDHLPIHCSIASRLRFLIVGLFGLGWVWVQLGTIRRFS